MAISRHDPEWKRVIFMALAGGASFFCTVSRYGAGRLGKTWWYADLPDGREVRANSKYDVALAAIRLMGFEPDLPDAAKKRDERLSSRSELRSS